MMQAPGLDASLNAKGSGIFTRGREESFHLPTKRLWGWRASASA
jgi:hypothetical protein